MRVRIAGCVIDICPQYGYMNQFLREYQVSAQEPLTEGIPVIAVSDAEIDYEQEGYEESFERGYLETLAVLRKLAEYLAAKDIMLFHGVAVEYAGKCYLIAARSGTGKSTHAFLWKRYLGDEQVHIINGDKPFIRCTDHEFQVYGTPWCGKEGLHINTQAELAGIIFIDRGDVCSIQRLMPQTAVGRLICQLHMTRTKAADILKLCDRLLSHVPCYQLTCDISRDAVRVCFEAVTGLDFEKCAQK